MPKRPAGPSWGNYKIARIDTQNSKPDVFKLDIMQGSENGEQMSFSLMD